MQLNWALVSGKQMEDDGTMETNIPHINPMSQGTPHWRTYLLVHGYIKERWKLLEMDGRTFAVFFCSLIFSDGSGECHRCQDIFRWYSVSFFGSR